MYVNGYVKIELFRIICRGGVVAANIPKSFWPSGEGEWEAKTPILSINIDLCLFDKDLIWRGLTEFSGKGFY